MLNSNFEEHAKKVLEKWNYQTIRKIGKGGFGHVVLASKFMTSSTNFYAIKCFSLKNNSKDANVKKYIQQEVKTMCNVKHTNVVRYESSFQDAGWYFIVMQYCDMGNLLTFQSKIQNKVLSFKESTKILKQIVRGVQVIHGQNIIHRDIKCENIFLKKNKDGGYVCKIGDFGFAKQIDQYTRTSCGTTLFMAPQVLKKLPYSYEADIWSIGVVFYFMLYGDYPFKSVNIEKDIYDKCVNGFTMKDSQNLFKDKKQFGLLEDFFKKIFNLDQTKRMTLDQMTEHPIFKTNDGQKTDDSFSNDPYEQEMEWYNGKIKFVEDLISDLTALKILEPSLLYAMRFYLFKILLTVINEEDLQTCINEFPSNKGSVQMKKKQEFIKGNLKKQYETLKKYFNQANKINKFSQGFNLQFQNFIDIKEAYRSTLSQVYSEVVKKIGNQNMKAQFKLRILCCHLINRVFTKGTKNDVFPNFYTWAKSNSKEQLKKQLDFPKLRQWINTQSAEKLGNQVETINKKFYSN